MDIGFAGLTAADLALLSLAKPKPLPVAISQETTGYLNSVALQSGWQQPSSTQTNKQSGEFTLDEQATIAAVGGDIGLDYDPRAKKFIEENPGTALALAAAPYVGMGIGLLGEIGVGAATLLLPTIAAEGGGGSQLANAGSRLFMTDATAVGSNVGARIYQGSTVATATPINPLYTALNAATAATIVNYGFKAIEDTNNLLGQNYPPTERTTPQQSQATASQPIKIWDVNKPLPAFDPNYIDVNPDIHISTEISYNKPTELEKTKHDDKSNKPSTSKQQQKVSAASFMPNLEPDDNDPDDEQKKDKEQRKNQEKFNECEKGESPIWKELKHYKVIDGKATRTNGLKGKSQRLYQWDNMHKEIEVYDHNGKPLRAMSPVTGRAKGKDVSQHRDINIR